MEARLGRGCCSVRLACAQVICYNLAFMAENITEEEFTRAKNMLKVR